MKRRWPGFALIAAILLAWEACSATGIIDPVVFPRVSLIFSTWGEIIANGELFRQLMPSLGRIFTGVGIAIAVAVPVGLLMGTVPFVHRLLEPLVEFIRPIPSSAYIPVAILFLGIGNEMKIFVVALACFFPILLNTYSGVRGIDPVVIDTGRTFGVTPLNTLAQIIFPAALPSILTGIQISLGLGLIVVVVAEMISGNNGIGYLILNMQRIFRVPEMFAGIFTLGLLGYLLNLVFLQIERYLLRWRISGEAG
jgi:ABC-type nitrate/sulfonate/bicarbonate transport system permease component